MFSVDLSCSLSDRKPVDDEDEVVVMIVPDYQMLEYVERIAAHLSDDPVCHFFLKEKILSDILLILIVVIKYVVIDRPFFKRTYSSKESKGHD